MPVCSRWGIRNIKIKRGMIYRRVLWTIKRQG